MSTETKHPMLWAWGCLIALFVLGFVNKCLNAQQTDSVPVTFGTIPPQLGGVTMCDTVANRPYIVIQNGIDGELLVIVLRHEKVHAKRMLAFKGGCREFQKRYNKDFRFRFDEEVVAYCSSEFKVGSGEMKAYWLDKLSTILYEQAGRFTMTYQMTKRLTAQQCGALGVLYAPP